MKAVTERFPFSQKVNPSRIDWLFFAFCVELIFLPFQLGRHFWPSFAFVLGERIDYLSPTFYISDIPIIIGFFILAIKKQIHIASTFMLVVAYLSLSAFFSQSPLNGWYGLLKFLELSLFILWVSRMTYKTNIVPYLFVSGILLESIISFLQYNLQRSMGGLLWFFGERTFSSSTPGIANASINGTLILRPYGTFPHPNALAGFLVIAMIYVGSLLYEHNGRYGKMLILVTLAIGTTALLLTLSRIAIIIWCLVVVGAIMNKIAKSKKKRLMILVIGSLFFLIITFFPHIAGRFGGINLQDEAVVQRVVLIQDSLAIIGKNPLFGVGLNSFLPELPTYEYSLHSPLLIQPVHNMYLLVFAELGLVGLVLFLWLMGASLLKTYKHFKKVRNSTEKSIVVATILSLISISVLGFFDHYFLTLQQGQLLFAFVIGMCWRKSMLQ